MAGSASYVGTANCASGAVYGGNVSCHACCEAWRYLSSSCTREKEWGRGISDSISNGQDEPEDELRFRIILKNMRPLFELTTASGK